MTLSRMGSTYIVCHSNGDLWLGDSDGCICSKTVAITSLVIAVHHACQGLGLLSCSLQRSLEASGQKCPLKLYVLLLNRKF